MKTCFRITLESHKNIRAISVFAITPIYPDFGTETRFIEIILTEMATIFKGLMNQYKFIYHNLFWASFNRINEKDQRKNEIDFFILLNINHNLTETDVENSDVKSQIERQIQTPQTKENGWILDKLK